MRPGHRVAWVVAGALTGRLTPLGNRWFSGPGALVVVGAVYPVVRADWRSSRDVWVEVASAVATGAADLLSATDSQRATVWFAHATFDLAHGTTASHRVGGSALPSWYPEVCAGYDVAVAWRLWRSRSNVHTPTTSATRPASTR